MGREEIGLTVIMVNYNGEGFLTQALASLQAELNNLSIVSEVMMVDNGSQDNSVILVQKEFPWVRILPLSQNVGFGGAANAAARESSGTYLFFLNHDVEVLPGCLGQLIDFIKGNKNYGVVAPAVHNPDGSFQLSFGPELNLVSEFFLKYLASHYYSCLYRRLKEKMERDVAWVSGVAFLIPRDVFVRLGGFDERFFLYVEDVDLCLRLRQQGWKIRFLPRAKIIHYRGAAASLVPDLSLTEAKRSQLLYYSLHRGALSFHLLKLYLLFQFGGKFLAATLAANKRKKMVSRRILELVWSFTRAPSS